MIGEVIGDEESQQHLIGEVIGDRESVNRTWFEIGSVSHKEE